MKTERLILRRWKESDAEDLFQYASDPEVGPKAGWKPHQSVKESLEVIQNVLSGPEAYALCLKENNRPIGAIELMLYGYNHRIEHEDECELGFWLAREFWGQGLMSEAGREMLRHGFEDLKMNKIWCAYFDGNERSKRVQERLGFTYQFTREGVDIPSLGEKRTDIVNSLSKEEWEKNRS